MSIHEVQCVYQGRTFFGIFEVAGNGPNEAISVRYNGDEIEAQTGGLPATAVASSLLSELIARRQIADKVLGAGPRKSKGQPIDLTTRYW